MGAESAAEPETTAPAYARELDEFDYALKTNRPISATDIFVIFGKEPFHNFRPLVLAVKRNRADVVRAIADGAPASLLRQNREAVLAAIKGKNKEVLSILLGKGIPVDAAVSQAAIDSGSEEILREVAEHSTHNSDDPWASCVVS